MLISVVHSTMQWRPTYRKEERYPSKMNQVLAKLAKVLALPQNTFLFQGVIDVDPFGARLADKVTVQLCAATVQ